MARQATGSLRHTAHGYAAQITLGKKVGEDGVERLDRPWIPLPTCETEEEALARKDLMASLVAELRRRNLEPHIELVIKRVATAPIDRLPRVRRLVEQIVAGEEASAPLPAVSREALTLKAWAEKWLRGDLARQYPDHVRKKATVKDDRGRLEKHVFNVAAPKGADWPAKTVGEIAVQDFLLEHAEEVMRQLPDSLASATRRQVAQALNRLANLAVYPGKLIDRSPLPKGWLPKVKNDKALAHLYPEEDAALLACVQVPLLHRLLYAFLVREGMRSGEAIGLEWYELDLRRGAIELDKNKTGDPRAWALGRDVTIALRVWARMRFGEATPTGIVFATTDETVDHDGLADRFRDDLVRAGVKEMRPILFKTDDDSRRQIRAHDLRATFVTLSLAAGRSEGWIMDRTGHRSSQMINRYRRAARKIAELGGGELTPMHVAIPEIGQLVASDRSIGDGLLPVETDRGSDHDFPMDPGGACGDRTRDRRIKSSPQASRGDAESDEPPGNVGSVGDNSRRLATSGTNSQPIGAPETVALLRRVAPRFADQILAGETLRDGVALATSGAPEAETQTLGLLERLAAEIDGEEVA